MHKRIRILKQTTTMQILKQTNRFPSILKQTKRMHKRIRMGNQNTFFMLLKISKELRAKTKLVAQAWKKLLAGKKAPPRQKLRTASQENNNVTIAWLRMTTGLIDDADFRITWKAWQCMEAQFRNKADFRMMPALPNAGTGDALESLYTFYNNPRDEDLTKTTPTLIKCIKRALGPWQYGWQWENKACPMEWWMGQWEYECIHGDMRWLAQMHMGSWPTESHLVPRKSGCAKETIENTDAVKIKKRVKALESIIKHTDFPWLTLEVSAHPIAPNPRDLTITKRQWEKAAMKYRCARCAPTTNCIIFHSYLAAVERSRKNE